MTTQTTDKSVAHRPQGLREILGDPKTKARFSEILGKRGAGFISSILSAAQSNRALSECDPKSIISAAAIAASLDLPISGALGAAAMVPYKEDGHPVAQFQIMRNGWVQLAQRTGQYALLNATEVYEGQLVGRNSFTGAYEFNEGAKKSEKVVGYVAYFKLTNGFEKYLYMTVEEIAAHGKRFSKSFDNPKAMWKKDFHSMALKTVIKRLISKWGPVSIDSPLAKAIQVDQAAIKEDGTPDYIDSTTVSEEDGAGKPKYDMPEKKSEEKAPESKKEEPTKSEAKKPDILTFKVQRVGRTAIGKQENVVVITTDEDEKLFSESQEVFDAAKGVAGKRESLTAETAKVADRIWIVSLAGAKA